MKKLFTVKVIWCSFTLIYRSFVGMLRGRSRSDSGQVVITSVWCLWSCDILQRSAVNHILDLFSSNNWTKLIRTNSVIYRWIWKPQFDVSAAPEQRAAYVRGRGRSYRDRGPNQTLQPPCFTITAGSTHPLRRSILSSIRSQPRRVDANVAT